MREQTRLLTINSLPRVRFGTCRRAGWLGLCLVTALASLPGLGIAQSHDGATGDNAQCIIVELFFSDGQEASEMALAGASRLSESRSGIRLVRRPVDRSEKAKDRLRRIAAHFRFEETSTPVIYCCNRVIRTGASADDFERQLRSALQIEVFTRIGCRRCDRAREWLPSLLQRYPGVEVVYREISNDAIALQDLNNLVRVHGRAATSTPVFHICNDLIVGFDRPQTTGARVEQALSRWATSCSRTTRPANRNSDSSGMSRQMVQEVAGILPFLPLHAWQRGHGSRP